MGIVVQKYGGKLVRNNEKMKQVANIIATSFDKGEKVVVEIKAGSVSSIGDTLYENNLIRSKFIFKIFVKLNGVNDLKASTYELDKNMKLKNINKLCN